MRRLYPFLFLVPFLFLSACDLLYLTEEPAEIPRRDLLYRGPNGDLANSVTALPSGGLVVAGLTNGGRGPLDGPVSIPLLLRVSPDGRIADTTVYRHASDGVTIGVVPYGNGLAVLLEEQTPDQEDPTLPNTTLYRTSPSGTPEGVLFERADTFLPRQPLRHTSDGGFLLVLSPSNGRPSQLVKLNSEGDVAWSQERPDVRSAVEASDGEVIVLGRHDSHQFDLTRLTPGGQERWHRRYGNDTLHRPEAVVPTGNGAAVLGTRSVPNSIEEWAVVTRVDETGDVVWEYEYGRGILSVTAITALPSGGLAFGYAVRTRETGPQRSYVVHLAQTGEVEWHRRFGPRAGDTRVNALTSHPDGTISAAGSTCSQSELYRIDCGDLLVVSYDAE